MKRIDKLTDEHRKMFKPWVEKWVDIGLRTGDTDWETLDKYIRVAYEKAKIPFPKRVIRVNSPIVGALTASILDALLREDGISRSYLAIKGAIYSATDSYLHTEADSEAGSEVSSRVEENGVRFVSKTVELAVHKAVNSEIGSALGSVVEVAIDSAINESVYSVVESTIDLAINESVHSEVVSAAVKSLVKSIKNLKWHPWFGGQFWVGGWWGSPSFVSFMVEVCGLELEKDIYERYECYRKLCESANYFWTNRNFVIVCARPKAINRNDRGQLHNENGLAIEYPDGWGLHCIDGVVVPEKVIMNPESITIEEIQKEENLEIQRIMIQRLGVDKYLLAIDADVIDFDIRGIEGGGARTLIREKNGRQWLVATDGSTERVYYLAASENARTCKEAHEELCGFSESRIKMEG